MAVAAFLVVRALLLYCLVDFFFYDCLPLTQHKVKFCSSFPLYSRVPIKDDTAVPETKIVKPNRISALLLIIISLLKSPLVAAATQSTAILLANCIETSAKINNQTVYPPSLQSYNYS